MEKTDYTKVAKLAYVIDSLCARIDKDTISEKDAIEILDDFCKDNSVFDISDFEHYYIYHAKHIIHKAHLDKINKIRAKLNKYTTKFDTEELGNIFYCLELFRKMVI